MQGNAGNLFDEVIHIMTDFITSLIEAVPLSTTGFLGLVGVVAGLGVVGLQQGRQEYVGRPGLVSNVLGFGGGLLVLLDFLPSMAKNAVLAFLILLGALAVIGFTDYLSGETTSNEWYEIAKTVGEGKRLALILVVLFVIFGWGLDNAIVFFNSWMENL